MTFLNDLAISTLSNLISVVIIAVIGYVSLVFRYSTKNNRMKRHIHPTKRVIQTNLNKIEKIERIDTRFINVFSKNEYDTIIGLYKSRTTGTLYNNPAIRIDDVFNNKVTISLVSFYDFIATNLLAFPANAPHSLKKPFLYNIIKYFNLFEKNRDFEYRIKLKLGDKPDYKQVLNTAELANIATVSILIADKDDKIGIVRRTKKVAISSGFFSSTVAGTPSDSDFHNDNPFFSCVKREVEEELGIKNIKIEFKELIISKQKMQPVFLFNGRLENTWESYFSTILDTEDYSFEIQNLFVVPQKDVICFVKQTNMTDASAYQLWKYSLESFGKDKWYNPFYSIKNIKKYCELNNSNE